MTAPPRRAGRGRREAANPLVERAEAEGIPVLRPDSARDADFQVEFAAWRPQLGVVVSYGQILDEALLGIPERGCINLHGSLLPRWRGASPVQAALLAGDPRTGVSLQRVVRELDAGAVLAERATEVGAREEAPALTGRLAELGAGLLVDFLSEVGDGALPAGAEQDPAQVTHCRKVRKEDGLLDWTRPAAEVERFVRAMAGWPVAQTTLPDGAGLRVHRGRLASAEVDAGAAAVAAAGAGTRRPSGAPGTVCALGEEISVICGDGGVYLVEEVQREGKARMAAGDFLRGTELAMDTQLGGA